MTVSFRSRSWNRGQIARQTWNDICLPELSAASSDCDKACLLIATTVNPLDSVLDLFSVVTLLVTRLDVEESGDGGRDIDPGSTGCWSFKGPTGIFAEWPLSFRPIAPFDSDLAESLVLRVSNFGIVLGTVLITGGRTRASWEIVGRLRFLDAVVEARASPDSFIFSGSFRAICFFEGAAG